MITKIINDLLQKTFNFNKQPDYSNIFKITPLENEPALYIVQRKLNPDNDEYKNIGIITIVLHNSYNIEAFTQISSDELDYLIKYAKDLAQLNCNKKTIFDVY